MLHIKQSNNTEGLAMRSKYWVMLSGEEVPSLVAHQGLDDPDAKTLDHSGLR